MQNVRAIIEQNKQLQQENARLTKENDGLKKRIASIDENAITRLRNKKDAEIKELQRQLGKAESEAVRSGNMAYSEHQRADESEGQIREMLGIPEIKYGIVFNRTRKPSGNRLNNGLVMPLLPLGIMPLVNTTTSNPRKETLLLGESSLKPSNEDLTQQMISNEKRLPTIYWKRYLGVA